MTDTTHNLKADAAGFLIGDKPLNPSTQEMNLLQRLRDEIRMFRGLFTKKDDAQPDEAPKDGGGAGSASVTHATPRLTNAGAQTKPLAMPELGKVATPVRNTAPAIVVKITQPVATPQRVTPERRVMDRALPMRDAIGRFLAQAKPVKPELNRPAKQEGAAAVGTERDVTGGKVRDVTGGKVRDLLGDIKDKIGGAVGGNEEVDPNIKAAQEIAGVAGAAFNGVKAVGGVLGTVATPMLSGAKGLFKPKANDAPTPWYKRFYNELRGLRREESVFNRAQLRTLKEIEAKPGEGKGGGFMGMLMMLIGPLIAAIGAAITAGFGLLMKLPGMGLLAKLATKLVPAVLLPKRPITQPTTVPGAGTPAKTSPGKTTLDPKTGLPVPDGGAKPVDATKKPTLWERTKTKVSGWTGKGKAEPVPATPVQEIQGPPKPPGRLAKAAGAVKRMAKVLPVLGRLMTLFSVTSSVAASEGDDNLSRGEKDKRAGSAIGGGVGGVVGGALGAMVAGPLGAIVGSFVGDKVGAIVGEEVGGWVTDIRNADIPGMIIRAWTKTTDAMGAAWTETTKWFEGKWESALSLFGGIWDKAKGVFDDLSMGATNLLAKFGIDLPAIKQKAVDLAAAAAETARETAALATKAAGAAKDKVVQSATAAVDYGKEKAGQAGDALKNSAVGKGVSAIAGVIQSVGETRVFQREDGGVEKRDGGTRAWRNNNPGNMEYGAYAKSQGAVGTDGRFAVFPSYEAGAKAKENLIFGGQNYKDKTLTEAIARYAPPNENNTGRYQAAILASVGGQNKRMADYTPDERTAILKAMEKVEGFKVGKTSVTPATPATLATPATPATAKPATATNAAPAIPAVPASTTVVTAGARNIPKMPSLAVEAPKVPDFQPVTAGLANTMGKGEEKRPSVIVVGNKTPVGRDLSNRPLAHIVTGGLSGS